MRGLAWLAGQCYFYFISLCPCVIISTIANDALLLLFVCMLFVYKRREAMNGTRDKNVNGPGTYTQLTG
jgi:hypothetical protein